jgi:GDPmannose 4,6-dehydratase
MWRMLQQDEPSDYVIATGKLHSVRDVVEAAFGRLGLDPRAHVGQDERFIRPAEVHRLVGDASKARTRLDWKPTIGFDELIALMVDHDLRSLRGEATVGRSLGG